MAKYLTWHTVGACEWLPVTMVMVIITSASTTAHQDMFVEHRSMPLIHSIKDGYLEVF